MPKLTQERIFSVIGSMYEIAQLASNDAWKTVYDEMAELVSSGEGGGLTVFNTHDNEFSTIIGSIPADLLDQYYKKYQHISPFRTTLAGLRAGQRFNRQEHMSDEEFRAHDYYRDFYSKAGIFHLEYQVFHVRDGFHGGIAFARPDGKENFGREELGALSVMLPHLGRAFQTFVNAIEAKRENRMIAEAFDRLPQCLFIVDRDRNIIFKNENAQSLLDRKDGFEISAGRLATSSPTDGKNLRELLDRIFTSAPLEEPKSECVLMVSRPSGKRPLETVVSLFTDRNFREFGSRPMAMLFLSDPEQNAETVEPLLQQMYGLTPAEALVAAQMANGNSMNEMCEILNIKPNTARTHIKRIFSKTDTNRQGELVKLILSGPAKFKFSPDR